MFQGTPINLSKSPTRRGVTLIEMTVVIVVLMVLIGISVFAVGGYNEWKLATEGSRKLRLVYSAQRTYLAEHPTEDVSTLTAAKIIPYLSDDSAALPKVESLDGSQLSIKVDVTPPIIDDGTGSAYDPSGDSKDNLWDVGG
ncbi:MAG: prepilin-type N-terminal cleavage/methylation domain-containing protein [Akkermansiaceae bacterium]